ncbi:MAG: hypothetical protein QM778_27290 [Myxococcales bacterium]
MNCPGEDRLLLELLGELSVNESSELERHRQGCASCAGIRLEYRQLSASLSSPAPCGQSDDAFVARVMERTRELALLKGESRRPESGRSRLAVRLGAVALGVAAAASLALWHGRPLEEHFAARGAKVAREHAVSAHASLFLVRQGVARPLEGAELQAGDGLAVRCSNPGRTARYLAVFVVDTAREVHWIYPSYVDANSAPESLRLEPGAHERLLPEIVEPELPAMGPMQAFALFTAEPVSVRDVEAQLSRISGGQDVRALLGKVYRGSQVQRWSATWSRK